MNWILRCCVCCFASVAEFLYVTLRHAWHFWLSFGACDHVTFELGFISYIISEFGGEGGGFKTSKRIWENLGNVRKKKDKFENFRAIWIFTWPFANISKAKTLCHKTFLPIDKERTQSGHILQQCLKHCPLSTTTQRVFIRIICTTLCTTLQTGPTLSKKRIFFRNFGNFREFLDNFKHF